MSLLHDITVVALEQAVAGPFASRQLADLGARVVKIERPGAGDFARGYDRTVNGMSSHFVWLNRSKQSLTLDLKRPAAKDVLWRLLAQADVFIQNLSPNAVDRLGFGDQRLRDRFPKLIVCNISGYGRDGPYADKKAYDLLIQGEAGLLSITGSEDTPAKAGISVADIAAGVYAYSGILAALYRRERTGAGSVVDVSLFDALAEWMSYPMYFNAYGGDAPQRTGARHATIAPYGPVSTKDDKTVILGLQNEREWLSFCQTVLLRPELATDQRFDSNHSRHVHREQLERIIDSVTTELTAQTLVERLVAANIAYGYMNNMDDFCAHEQLTARARWRTIGTSQGSIRALLPPVSLDNESATMEAVPDVGEHNADILQQLGYSVADIEQLKADGAI